MPLSTATPKRAIKPTPAEMLNGIPRSHKAATPPMAESGMAVKIRTDCRSEPNVKNSSTKMSSRATGTAMLKRSVAWRRFSNCPP